MKTVIAPAVAAIGAALLVGLGPAIWKRLLPDKAPPIEYKIAVYSTLEKSPPIARANVELNVPGEPSATHDTDPQGVVTFRIDSAHANKSGRILIIRSGFERLERPITVPLSSAQESVYLEPTSRVESRGPEIKVFSSGPKASGLAEGWSQPYEICSDAPPDGYMIDSSEFSLRGDRSCGAWAECSESQRSGDKVCWSFRLQGHNEWFPPRPAFSEGILRVTFKPKS